MNNAPVPPLLRFGKALRWHPFAAWMIVGIGMILVAGCLGPKSAPAPIADTSAPAVSTVAEDELLPPVQTNLVDLKTMPRQTFTGLRQNEAPAPAWTLEHYHALGHPVISPDGKWLVITRPGNWFRHGECLVVVDLMNRKVSEHTPPLPGVVGSVVFDREGRNLLGVVNTTGGYSLARWDFPAMSLNLTNLGTGIAIAATLTHAQDRVLVMRDDGIVGVFDATDGAKLLDVGFQKGKPEFYSSALVVTADDAIIISGVVHPANQLVRWRLADGSRVESLPAQQHLAWGRTFATTRDGKTVLGITSFGLAALDSATGESRATYPGNGLYTLHYQPAMDLAAAPIGQGESFGVVDVTTGQLRFWAKHAARPPAPLGYAGWACVSPDGQWVYSADDYSIKAWDLAGGITKPPDWLFAGRDYRRVAVSPDGTRLAAFGETLDAWDLGRRRIVGSVPQAAMNLTSSSESLSPELRRTERASYVIGGRIFAIVTSENDAEVFDTTTGKIVVQLGSSRREVAVMIETTMREAVVKMKATPPAQMEEQRAAMLEAMQRQMAVIFPREGHSRISVSPSPDGRWLAVVDPNAQQRNVTVWSLETGKLVSVFGVGNARA